MSARTSIRRLLAVTAMVAAAATGTSVLAQDNDTDDDVMQVMPFGYGPYGRGPGNMAMMAQPIDIDGDGIVSASEASRHASAGFALFDGDGDDEITEDEYMDSAPAGMPMGRRNTEQLYLNRAARFEAMDADSDGTVTLAEFMANAQASFEAADADADGNVTVWEFRAQRNPF